MLTDQVDEITIAEHFLRKTGSIPANNAQQLLLIARTKRAHQSSAYAKLQKNRLGWGWTACRDKNSVVGAVLLATARSVTEEDRDIANTHLVKLASELRRPSAGFVL